MKMKKLMALTLAGVLCLGMSTTAFAAKSPDRDKAEEERKVVTSNDNETKASYTDEWGDEQEVDITIKNEALDKATMNQIATWREDPDQLKEDVLAAAAKDPNVSIDADAPIYYLEAAADYKAYYTDENGKQVAFGMPEDSTDGKFTIDFNLSGIENIDKMIKRQGEGATIYLMHEVSTEDAYGNDTTEWVLVQAELILNSDGTYVARAELDSLSPIAFVLGSDGQTLIPDEPGTDEPGTDEPGTDEPGTDIPTPPSVDNGANANGTITADQLADLIVKKLQQNAAASTKAGAVVRTAGKASPKTGE